MSGEKYEEKVVWVIGASSGVGEAIAREASGYKAKLILSSRSKEKLEKIGGELTSQSAVLDFDVAETSEAEENVQAAVEIFGKIDMVVLCSGLTNRNSVADTDLSVLDKIMRVNFLGPAAIAKHLLPVFKSQGAGKIVVISSVQGKMGLKNRAPYAASKHALHGYFDSLRLETKKENISVTLVVLGYVKTNLSLNSLKKNPDDLHGAMDKRTAEGFEPDYVAKKVLEAGANGKDEVVIAQNSAIFGLYLRRFSPWLLNLILERRE
eukprot:maker-scaffold_7-snap-gene-4.11-mRNA-1 protein AED:0.01 eAED:0.01 QI:325/1/1/1/0/0.5/2/163/264